MFQIVDRLTAEIELGLARDTHSRSTVKSFVTHVQNLPTGKERGKYLVLELGDATVSVLLVYIKSETDIEMTSKTFELSKNLKHGSGNRLFQFFAKCLAEFCHELNIAMENLPLSFVFSFPCEQEAVDIGVLLNWKSGFNSSDVEGENVTKLLQNAINRRTDIRVNVVAMLTGTTGSLLSLAFSKQNCFIGIIVGSTTNASYVEKTLNTQMLQGYETSLKDNMIINTEWGTFGENGELDFIRTDYDIAVDKLTSDQMRNIFEKCVSGIYLGEIVRQILLDLMDKQLIFKGQKSNAIREPWTFDTRYMLQIEAEMPGQYRATDMVLHRLGITTNNQKDLACVRYVCNIIAKRSAMLMACGLVSLIKKMDVSDISVAVDGGIYRFHPTYHDMIMENVNLLLKDSATVELVLSEKGTALGAAFVAASSICKCRGE